MQTLRDQLQRAVGALAGMLLLGCHLADAAEPAGPPPLQVRIQALLIDGKQEAMSIGATVISGDTAVCVRERPPPVAAAPQAARQDDDDDDIAKLPPPVIESKLEVTPTLDNDKYTMSLKLAWEAAITPKDQSVPRKLTVDTSLLIWDGASLSIPLAAAGEIAGHEELTLVIRATLIDPAGQPVRGKK